ncbi:MAG: hypothetical protein ABIT04_04380 [Novosphingobium sp.]
MQPESARPTPGTFWAFALLSLAWNGLGAYDFIMTNLRDPGYLAHFPPELVDYLDTMPAWAVITWALSTWSAAAGSLLLLLRSRFAVEAFFLSLICLGIFTMYQGASQLPAAMRTPSMMVATLVIWMGAIGFAAFAFWHRKGGLLR